MLCLSLKQCRGILLKFSTIDEFPKVRICLQAVYIAFYIDEQLKFDELEFNKLEIKLSMRIMKLVSLLACCQRKFCC